MAATGSLIPATVNLQAVIGADFSTTIQLFTDANQTVAFDLTGYTVLFSIGGGLLNLTSGAGLVITTATGTIVASVTAAQSAALSGQQHYTLKLTDGSGAISFPLSGTLTYSVP